MKRRSTRFASAALAAVFILLSLALPASAAQTAASFPQKYLVKRYFGEAIGVTQEKVVSWLTSHEHDKYYLGTPYTDYPVGSPNKDPNFILNKQYTSLQYRPGMNCSGFVSHVLCKCGLDLDKWLDYMADAFPHRWNEQTFDAGSANMWYLYVTGDEHGRRFTDPVTGKSDVTPGENGSDVFVCYAFNSTAEALESGLLRKGDICIYWPTEGFDHAYDGTIDSHIGFFWGDTPHSNRFWHSSSSGTGGNKITNMHPMTKLDYVLYVVPISPRSEIDEIKNDEYWNSRGTLGLAGLELEQLGVQIDRALIPGVFVPPGFKELSDTDKDQ